MRILLLALCLTFNSLVGCSRTEPPARAPILLFNGVGTSPNDVAAVEKILQEHGWNYATADSRQLNRLTEQQLSDYQLLIIPGGHYIHMGEGLTPETTRRVQRCVQNGLNYLGICAGGLLAGKAKCNSLNLAGDAQFDFYAAVNQGVHQTAVKITCAAGPMIEHYWEDGPQFASWGDVVGKYPDGTPAIVEGKCGAGWVILCGSNCLPSPLILSRNWSCASGAGWLCSPHDCHARRTT